MDNQDADMTEMSPDVPTSPVAPEVTEAQAPVLNGQTVEQVKYLDYGDIRVVFDAKTGGVLGVMPVKKVRKNVKAS